MDIRSIATNLLPNSIGQTEYLKDVYRHFAKALVNIRLFIL